MKIDQISNSIVVTRKGDNQNLQFRVLDGYLIVPIEYTCKEIKALKKEFIKQQQK